MSRRLAIFLIFSSFLFSCSAVFGATDAKLSFSKGMLAFSDGEFNEALPYFQKAYKFDSTNPDHIYLLGLTHLRLNQPALASKYFKEIFYKNPDFSTAYNDYGVSLYSQNKFKDSLVWFTKAHEADIKNPSSLLYIGLAYHQLGNDTKAVETLNNVVSLFPKTEVYKTAHDWIDRIKSGKKPEPATQAIAKRFKLSTSVSGFYDSNVISDPDFGDVDGFNTNQDAPLIAGSLDINFLLHRGEKVKLSTGYFGYQNGHFNYTGTQMQSLNAGRHKAWAEFQHQVTPNFQWRLPVYYLYQSLGAANYTQSTTAEWTANLSWKKNWVTSFTEIYRWEDFFNEPLNPRQIRNNMRVTGRLEQFFFFPPKRNTYIKLGYEIERNFAEGNDWDYIGHKILWGWHNALPLKFKLTAFGNIGVDKNFDNANSIYPPASRGDFSFSGTGVLSHGISKHFSLATIYSFIMVDSNIIEYTYKRQLVGITFTYSI